MNKSLTSTVFNLILRALPVAELNNLRSFLEPIVLYHGEVIYQAGEQIKYAYFPETCLVSMQTIFTNGTSVESGLIGYEGAVGTWLALSKSAPNRQAFVQISGTAYRISAALFSDALLKSPALNRAILHYAFNYIEQAAQIGACNCSHTVDMRLMRMLLVCRDRTAYDTLRLTQEGIAQILGVNRPSVSVCAKQLKDAGIIDYDRGNIRILNAQRLEADACECYQIIRQTYDMYIAQLEDRLMFGYSDNTSNIS